MLLLSGSWPATQIISRGVKGEGRYSRRPCNSLGLNLSCVPYLLCNLRASVSSPGTWASTSGAVKGTSGTGWPWDGFWLDHFLADNLGHVPTLSCASVSLPLKWDGELPGGPVVKTRRFHCRGLSSIPCQGTKIPHAPQRGQKKIKWDGNIPTS